MLAGTTLYGAGVPFEYTEVLPENYYSQRSEFISHLKVEAIKVWLKRELKDRYEPLESKVTEDFGEKYLIYYELMRLDKSGNPIKLQTPVEGEQLKIKGELDASGLREWIRLAEAKSQGASLRPLLLVTSTLPNDRGLQFPTSSLGQLTVSHLKSALQKLGIETVVLERLPVAYDSPARDRREIQELKQLGYYHNVNTAIWAHYRNCPECGGARLELNLYDLKENRISRSRSENLKWPPAGVEDPKTFGSLVAPTLELFEEDIRKLLGEGTVASGSFSLTVKGLKLLNALSKIEQLLSQSGLATGFQLVRASNDEIEFEIKSSHSTQTFVQRLGIGVREDIPLKLLEVDSQNLVVRYSL